VSPSEDAVEERISQKVAVGVVFVAAVFMSIMDGNALQLTRQLQPRRR
jgi:hypothetical protein